MSFKESIGMFLTKENDYLSDEDFFRAVSVASAISSRIVRTNYQKDILKKNMESRTPAKGLVKLMSRKR
jgi:hypothetical protein